MTITQSGGKRAVSRRGSDLTSRLMQEFLHFSCFFARKWVGSARIRYGSVRVLSCPFYAPSFPRMRAALHYRGYERARSDNDFPRKAKKSRKLEISLRAIAHGFESHPLRQLDWKTPCFPVFFYVFGTFFAVWLHDLKTTASRIQGRTG